jgi:uncharacterized protein YxeA
MANQLKTYGDLKKLLNTIALKQKGEKIVSKGKEFALDQVLGLIPGASNAKTTFDFIKAAMSKPDSKKTNTWIDKLDIDDQTSAIIDNTVENGFMKYLSNSIDKMSDDQDLEDDFNMNQKLVDYLKTQYKGRTITGIQEVDQPKPSTSAKIQGTFNTQNIKAVGMDPSKFNMVMGYLKQGKEIKDLNLAAKELLADFFLKLLKTDDDRLLMKVFSDIKRLKTK